MTYFQDIQAKVASKATQTRDEFSKQHVMFCLVSGAVTLGI